jgi:RND family efflux transporter MFP subunit
VQEQRVDDTIIRAPFSGVVIAKTAQPGEMISPVSAGGGFTRTGIGTIVDMDSLEIEVDVNEAYIQRVQSGQRVTARLDAYPDWNIPAEVIAIVPTADRQKATVKVRIGFMQKDERVLPDMGVRVAFLDEDAPEQVASRGEISIPEAALLSDDEGDAVLRVEGDTLTRQPVVVSRRDGRRVFIESGLVGGERIVIADLDDLRDGMKVAVN